MPHAHYERVREGGVIRSQAVLGRPAPGAGRGAGQSGKPLELGDFLLALKARGLHGVEFVVSDDHPGLKKAIQEILPEAAWQRCYVHFSRNALD